MINKPTDIDEKLYYAQYIHKVSGNDLIQSLNDGFMQTRDLVSSIKEEQGSFRYEEGKWTIKQVLMHIADTEHILTYRALRIARGDQKEIGGFDENAFAKMDNSHELSIEHIMKVKTAIRLATVSIFSSFNDELLDRKGITNGMPMTPRILGWFLLGHQIHHNEILIDRYISKL